MYITADQQTISRALGALRQLDAAVKAHRVHGRYALDLDLTADAAAVIDRAVAYCDQLGADIGQHTLLGSCGSPAGWGRHFMLMRRWLPTVS
jgi:hypothetical protein